MTREENNHSMHQLTRRSYWHGLLETEMLKHGTDSLEFITAFAVAAAKIFTHERVNAEAHRQVLK